MKWSLTILFVALLSPAVEAQTNEVCGAYLLMREARSEGIITQRAVVDTLLARAKKRKLSLCQVAKEEGQFPYMVEGVKKIDKHTFIRYNVVLKMERVLSEDYLFFNNKPHSWGRGTVKIGNLYFSK